MEMSKKEKYEIGSDMLPFVMEELVAMVMTKKSLSLEDALYYIYSSKLYRTLLDEKTKLWYLSTLSIYDILKKEKASDRHSQTKDADILLFEIFCIEKYRMKEKKTAKETLFNFTEYAVFSFLEDSFEVLHTQDVEYILDSIKEYIEKKMLNSVKR